MDHERPAHGRGPSGSICLTLYTTREPGSDPAGLARLRHAADARATHSAVGSCATAPTGCRGRSRPATVTRPTPRTVYLRFAQSAIDRPDQRALRRRGRHARRPLPAAARLPRHGAGRSDDRKLTLRSTTPSG